MNDDQTTTTLGYSELPHTEIPHTELPHAERASSTRQPRRRFLHQLAGVPVAIAVGGAGWLSGCGTGASESGGGADSGGQGDASSDAAADSEIATDGLGTDSALTDAPGSEDAGSGDAGSGDTGEDAARGGATDASDASASDDADAVSGADVCSADAQGSGPQPCTSTGADLEGPYYEPKAAATTVLAGPKEPGERLKVSGRVLAHGCALSIAGATVEVWHADAAGQYRDLTHATPLRATLTTDCNGGYGFDTVVPGAYLDAGGYRPQHIHFRVTTPDGKVLITQLYFAGDPYLSPNDSCGSCQSGDASHIIALKPVGAMKTHHHGIFDVVM